MTKLAQRIVTAAVLIVVLLAVLFLLPYPAAVAVFGAFVAVAAWEWAAFIPLRTVWTRAGYTLLLIALMFAAWIGFPRAVPQQPVLWAALAWWCLAYVMILRFPLQIGPLTGAVCGLFVILPAWTALIMLFGLPGPGSQYLLYFLVIIWAADIGAYFVGRRFGRTRLAPRVSPGKTWEGFFGGLGAALCVAGLGGAWFGWSPWFVLPAAASVAMVSVIGDLTVSLFKRNAGLKDSGNLFPGHGGVLDRIDSVTAAIPLFVLELSWAGVLPG